MRCQPILSALRSVDTDGAKILLTSPRGKTFSQEKALELSKEQHLVFIAGHYEGIDERVNAYADELISVGDFVLTGGELPIMLISDAVIRLIDGVISEASVREESVRSGSSRISAIHIALRIRGTEDSRYSLFGQSRSNPSLAEETGASSHARASSRSLCQTHIEPRRKKTVA